MPSRVHALIVVRPDGRAPAAFHLKRTLRAVDSQTRRPDTVTVVLCGSDDTLATAAASGSASVVTAPAGTGYASALDIARRAGDGEHDPQGDAAHDDSAVWLLAQDTAPEAETLARLLGALEVAPSVAIAAPKLVRWDDRTEIASLGVSMTRFGRTVGLSDGELDQGQRDAEEDVLGADVRGMLVRSETWHSLGGLDRGLAGADEGLDLSVRARLLGARVSLVPSALVAVAGDGAAGLPTSSASMRGRHNVYARRHAQLQRRLAYAPVVAVAFHWLSILPLALWRTMLALVAKTPARVLPEWGAAFVALVRVDLIARARTCIHRTREIPWSRLAPLRVTRAQLRERFDHEAEDGSVDHDAVGRSDLRFFTGGGAWAVLGALVLSIAAFPALLAWPVLGGGALQPLPATVARLWADAAYGLRSTGLDGALPADPYAGVIALIGSLAPADPSRAVVLLWILALPLAVLGGWFAATRVTERPLLRILAGVAWALAPTFLAALVDGRPTGVLVHLLLPWALFAGSVAHRSWAAAGAASIVVAAIVACSPSLAPAVVVVWLGMIVLTAVVKAGRGLSRVLWLVVPTVVVAIPLVWEQLRAGNPWGLLADPGLTWRGPQVAASVHGRALLAAGFPTADPGGWGELLHQWGWGTATWWVPLLVAPIAVLALLAPFTPRWAAGIVLLVLSALGIGTAFAAVSIAVASSADAAVAIWPGAGLSLAWAGALGAAIVFLDSGLALRLRLVRSAVALLVMACLAVVAVPALTSATRGTTLLTNGPASTLPAYVAAEGRQDAQVGTFTITPLETGAAASDVVWGGSETLAGHSTVQATATKATPADHELAALTADLVTSTSPDVVARLAAHGIGFVVLTPAPTDESDQARALSMQAKTALDQRDGLEQVGTTGKGTLWRVANTVANRVKPSDDQQRTAVLIAVLQLGVLLAALLLAIPTRASRRAARRAPRIVGPRGQEAR